MESKVGFYWTPHTFLNFHMNDPRTLYHRSILAILEHQHEGGGYVASPTYPSYQYGWFRDGSYIAYAMVIAGEFASSERYHRWVGSVLERYSKKMESLIERKGNNDYIPIEEQMHSRFTLEGEEVGSEWGNFQLDGFGTWLFALAEHVSQTGNRSLLHDLQSEVSIVIKYLEAFWESPCFDCWEEHGDQVHIATLSALIGGLEAIGRVDQHRENASIIAQTIRAFLLGKGVKSGVLVKSPSSHHIDASLISVALPYRVFALDDPVIRETVWRIEAELGHGGVHRYPGDEYYGGGAWILLTAWLGWYYASIGNLDKAEELRDWVVSHAGAGGTLPEQVPDGLLSPQHLEQWIAKAGESATPLLWSHAMYILLEHEIFSRRMPTAPHK